ncbi:MAG: DUF1365 domain-containing protein [Candidatus Melainabacteria bacterium]|nr:DUF1365 domain-containing protein [Candidatus Melainabacteria bacterium]
MVADPDPSWASCLYVCQVMHRRRRPKPHGFGYHLFMFYLDLDELPHLDQTLAGFGWNRKAIYSFWESDHLPLDDQEGGARRSKPEHTPSSLKERVRCFVRQQGLSTEIDRVMMLTHCRFLGYTFNPIVVYYCFYQNQPVCAVVQVENTFREMKAYLVPPSQRAQTSAEAQPSATIFRSEPVKYFYVSPFTQLTERFAFRLPVPNERLSLVANTLANCPDAETKPDAVVVQAGMTGDRVPLTAKRLLSLTLRNPFVTLGVISHIHFQAFRLWWKRVPYRRKDHDPQSQQNVLRPHASLQQPPSSKEVS